MKTTWLRKDDGTKVAAAVGDDGVPRPVGEKKKPRRSADKE